MNTTQGMAKILESVWWGAAPFVTWLVTWSERLNPFLAALLAVSLTSFRGGPNPVAVGAELAAKTSATKSVDIRAMVGEERGEALECETLYGAGVASWAPFVVRVLTSVRGCRRPSFLR